MTPRNVMTDRELAGVGDVIRRVMEHVESLTARVRELEAALTGMVERYVSLVECGDCGTWDAEKEPEVIAARAALAKATP